MKAKTLFVGVALAVAALISTASTASAQHRGGYGGGYHGGGYGGGYGGYRGGYGTSLNIGFGPSYYAPRPLYYPSPVYTNPVYGPTVVNNFATPGFATTTVNPVFGPVVVGQSYIAPPGLAPGFATSPVYRTYQYAPGVVGYNTNFRYVSPGFRLGVSVFR